MRNYQEFIRTFFIPAMFTVWVLVRNSLLGLRGLCIGHAVLPLEDPIIRGLRSQYQIGDPVNLTCSYGPSKPNASLTWYINDRKVRAPMCVLDRNKGILTADGHSQPQFGCRIQSQS